MLDQKRRHALAGTGALADEKVVRRERLDGVAAFAGTLDDRLPVDGVVALAVDHLHGAGKHVESGQDTFADTPDGGGEHGDRTGLCVRLGVNHRREGNGPAEAEAEQADTVVALRPVERDPDVVLFTLAAVPGAVVEAQTVNRGGKRLGDRPEPAVGPVTPGLWVWGTGDDDRPTGPAVEGGVQIAASAESNAHTEGVGCKNFKFRRFVGGDMGILSRTSYIIRSKINALLNRAEDPGQQLDYSYEQMQDELQNVKQGIADLTTQKKRLEIQKRRLEENVERHNEQARTAVEQGRDDLARRALEKKKQKMNQIEGLERQIDDLEAKQDELIEQKDELQQQIEEFRTRKETMKARYEAAEASARVSEAVTGAGEEMEDVSRAIERAEERTEEMEARAAALDELRESGALENSLSDKSELDRELEALSTDSAVDTELETLKAEMGAGEAETEADVGEATDGDLDEQTGSDLDAELEELDAEVTSEDIDKELEGLKEEE